MQNKPNQIDVIIDLFYSPFSQTGYCFDNIKAENPENQKLVEDFICQNRNENSNLICAYDYYNIKQLPHPDSIHPVPAELKKPFRQSKATRSQF